MGTSPLTWSRDFRIVTLCTLLILGVCCILIALFNYTTNPEPQPDVRIPIAKMVAYLVLVALPHRWVTHSRVRSVVTFFLLCIPVSMSLYSLASEVGARFSAGSASLHYFSVLPLCAVGILFYSVGALSLYLSWRYGRNTA
jgi:hypothetical protein